MINIDELRQRVEDAERRFGVIDERQKAYSARLSSMIEGIDARQQDSEARLRESENSLRRAKDENEQLRSLLHQLLMAIDGAGRDYLKNPVSELNDRLSALVGSDSVAAETPPGDAAEKPAEVNRPVTLAATEKVAENKSAIPSAADLPETPEETPVREILQRINGQIGDAEAP